MKHNNSIIIPRWLPTARLPSFSNPKLISLPFVYYKSISLHVFTELKARCYTKFTRGFFVEPSSEPLRTQIALELLQGWSGEGLPDLTSSRRVTRRVGKINDLMIFHSWTKCSYLVFAAVRWYRYSHHYSVSSHKQSSMARS